ncbi:hypothetical protein ACLI1A_17440 [Flavobacterium sp. RHBU_3]|uniref:hypothetical protein n=1 Tax=Flavobacterium sp. RHBU_3 TaxID=3391184 RepID=UPI0039853B28
MEPYFLLLQLEDDQGHIPDEDTATICDTAAQALLTGKANIVCMRNDTGVSEDLRAHASTLKRFTTYIILQIHATSCDLVHSAIFIRKIYKWLKNSCSSELVHSENNYRLIAVT